MWIELSTGSKEEPRKQLYYLGAGGVVNVSRDPDGRARVQFSGGYRTDLVLEGYDQIKKALTAARPQPDNID